MKKEKEIEMLIAKYRADIAALEEREVDLERQIEIMENLIPNVIVSFLGKSFLTVKESPNPETQTEAEISTKVEHLKNVLQELRVGIALIREEKQIMKKRIEELETFLADKTINVNPSFVKAVPNPSKHGIEGKTLDKVSERSKSEGSGSQKAIIEKLGLVETGNVINVSPSITKPVSIPSSHGIEGKSYDKVSEYIKSKGSGSQKVLIEKLVKTDKIIDDNSSFVKSVSNPSQPGTEYNKHDKVSESLKSKESGIQKPIFFENLVKTENTNWQSAYEDLKNKVADLTKNFDDTSKKLMESKGYLDKLEEKYANLKKEFQSQIEMLERMNSKSNTEIANKEQNNFVDKNKSPFNVINDPSGVGSKHTVQSGKTIAYEPEQLSYKNEQKIIPELNLERYNKLDDNKPEKETGDVQSERLEKTTSVLKHGKSAIFNKKLEGASKDQLQMPKPEKPNLLNATSKHDTRTLQNKPSEDDQSVKFDLLVQDANTDWKKVYENLQKQIYDLTNKLNDSSQKLMESKGYVKNLEDKYSSLKKEMQAQIEELELKTDSFISDVISNEPAKYTKTDQIPITHESRITESRPTKKTNSRTRCIASGCTLTHLNEQPQPHFDHTSVLKPKESSKITNYEISAGHNNDEIKDQHELPKGLVLLENTDWKKVCEDLQKKVIDLSQHQNNSLQKLEDSENYIKNLQEEYSSLVKELRERIKVLEKKTDSLISAVFSKEQEKYLKEELESKGTISAIQETLAEVRSMKESLSKKTLSRVRDC